MKTRFYTFFLTMASMLVMNSCSLLEEDLDRAEARDLSGQWTGDFGMYYTYQYRGRTYRFDSYHTDITLIPEHQYAKHGHGYQVDWYESGPYSSLSYYFKWEVRGGNICLTYPGNNEWDTVIYEYALNDVYFRGYFGDSNSRFNLRKIAGYYDWSLYYGIEFGYTYYSGYDYYPYGSYYNDYYDGYYYVKGQTRSSNDSTTIGNEVHRGNRFTEICN